MNKWVFIEESIEEYSITSNLSDQLDDLLDHFEKKDQSQSLREDIDRLSDICRRYSNKRIVYIYQELLEKGYYIDEYYLFNYALKNSEKLLRDLILQTIKNSENSVINTLAEESPETFIHQMIDKNRFEFDAHFSKKFINSQGQGIYYCERKKGLIELILHLPTEKIYDLYVKHLNDKGLSQITIDNYTVDLRIFIEWLEKINLSYSDLDRSIAKKYLEYILKGHQISSYNKILLSLSSFNKYLVSIGIYKQLVFIQNKDQIKDLTIKNVEIFSIKEQEIIRQLIEENRLSQKTTLVLSILFYTGVRVTELVNIRLDHIDYEKKELIVIGKGKKRRSIPLKSCVLKRMANYINGDRKKSKYKNSPYLIVSQRKNKMTREAVSRLTKSITEYVNTNVYPHKFRHSFASRLVKKGILISTVAEILGHKDIQTTLDYYVNTSKEDKLRAIELL